MKVEKIKEIWHIVVAMRRMFRELDHKSLGITEDTPMTLMWLRGVLGDYMQHRVLLHHYHSCSLRHNDDLYVVQNHDVFTTLAHIVVTMCASLPHLKWEDGKDVVIGQTGLSVESVCQSRWDNPSDNSNPQYLFDLWESISVLEEIETLPNGIVGSVIEAMQNIFIQETFRAPVHVIVRPQYKDLGGDNYDEPEYGLVDLPVNLGQAISLFRRLYTAPIYIPDEERRWNPLSPDEVQALAIHCSMWKEQVGKDLWKFVFDGQSVELVDGQIQYIK